MREADARQVARMILVQLLAALDNQPISPKAHFSKTERKLLENANGTPIPGKAMIRKAGLSVNSHTRTAITSLVRKGELVRTADGYTRKG